MNPSDILQQAGGLQSIAREFGLSEQQVAAGAEALLPALLGGFKRQAVAQSSGLEGLLGMLGGLGGGGLLDDVLSPEPTNVARGNDVLGQVFGTREVSRTVAQSAAARSGLDPALLKKLLPVFAMLVAGYLAKQGRGGTLPRTAPGGSTGFPGSNPGAGRAAPPAGAGGGLGGLASMLDLDRDGNPLDDLLGLAGKFLR
jgi:hypothetical protein